MKILAYGDIHIRETSPFIKFNQIDSNGLTKELNNFIKGCEFIAETIKKEKPDIVVNLGDVFQSSSFLSMRVIETAYRGFSLIKQVLGDTPHYLIPRNHDIYKDNFEGIITSVRSVMYFMKLFDTPEFIENDIKIGFIPYMSRTEDFLLTLKAMKEKVKCDVIFTHAEFNGSKHDNGVKSKSDIKLDKSFDIPIISGHMHVPQDVGNVHYVGSLIQNTFIHSDLSKVGGCLIYDSDDKSIRRIKNNKSLHYVKIKDISQLEGLDKDRCILLVALPCEYSEVKDLLRDYNHSFFRISENRDEVNVRYEKVEIDSKLYYQNYLKSSYPEYNFDDELGELWKNAD